MNIIEKSIEDLMTMLQTNQHVKDKIAAQTAWDKTKRVLLGNRKWL